MADIIGRRLGNYRLVRHLGYGGFAEVYLGEHLYLKSEAALKVLLTSPKNEEVEYFLQEAQTLVGLRHPNIVRVLEFGVEGDIPFLVMDYAPGGTARHRYPTGTRLPLTTAVAYIKQVAIALQYAHNRGIIHRDVKPENILLDFDQHILLSDFGLALFAPTPELLSTQKGAGTALYMPPEQLQGKPTFASDQYALAVVAYEWLCGKRLFEGDVWALFHQHMFVPPPPLRQICPDLPAAIEEVILRALAKDPQQRFTSIQAFAFALERASQVNAAALSDNSQITAPLRDLSPSSEVTPTATKHSRYGSPTQRRVFLTAAPADEAFAARLQADLHARGILVSHDRPIDMPSADQQGALRQDIRDAHIALVVVSPQTRSSRTVKEQVRIISMYQRHLVFVWAAGDDIASALPEAWGRTAMIDLVDAREARYKVALDEIIAFLEAEVSTGTPEQSTLPTPPGEPRNPYKGLRAFTGDDAADFFGRDALIEEMAETLEGSLTAEQHNVPAARLLTVIGPSGSGKSSVVMAGLLPGLQRGALPGSEAWVYLDPIVPGQRPLESLTLAFAPHLPERSLRAIRHDLEDDSARGLQLLATQLVKRRGYLSPGQGSRVVLMIDQFEELFTQTLSERERQRFIDLLVAAVTEPVGPLIVLLTLRADFYDRPMHYPQLSQLIEAHHKSVLPMNLRDLRAVIEQPAALPDVQLLFEGDLVGDLLFEAQGQAGALPLLEFTLDQLFQQRDGHWLTRKAYLQIGGVKGALAKHAESTYASLPSDQHRRLARALFLRLIDPGVTEQDTTRRRAALSELSLPDPKQTAIMREVADTFVTARLLMTNEVAGTTTIEVSHEALIREWARLAEWLREAREDITLQQAISGDAAEWVRRGRPVDRLYRGAQLTEAQVWAERNVPNADEVDFLHGGAIEQQYQEDVALNQQGRELNLQRRVVSRQRLLITALSLFSVVVILLASLAELSREQANQQRQIADAQGHRATIQASIARSQALAADASFALSQNKLDQALLLSAEAYKIHNTYEARNSLLNALEQSPHIVTMLRNTNQHMLLTLAFSSNGRMLVAADNFAVYIWDINSINGKARPVLTLNQQHYVGAIALSLDDRTLAISNASGVWLWDIQTGAKLAQLDGPTPNPPAGSEPRTALAFSLDGQFVESARCSHYAPNQNQESPLCVETKISEWNVSSRQLAGSPRIIQANANSVAFSPGGQMLATTSGASIQLWNVATGQPFGSLLIDQTGTIRTVAFSPDSTRVASASGTSIQLWSVATGQPLGPPLEGHTDSITNLAFSPDGHTLASSSLDKTVLVWNVMTGKLITKLTGDAQYKLSVAFGPDGIALASGSADGTILLWNIGTSSTISQRLADAGILWSTVFTPDGRRVLAGNDDGKIIVEDVKTAKLITVLDTVGYSLRTPKDQTSNNLHSIQSLALSRDGTTLAAGRLDGTIILWNMKMGKSFVPFVYPTLLYKVILSTNGQVLAAVGSGNTIILWDIAKKIMLHSIPYAGGSQYPTPPVALSPDGKLLAVGGCGQIDSGSCVKGQVQFWNVATGKVVGQTLFGHQSDVSDVAFSPDGHTLASSSYDGIILWDVSTRKSIGKILSLTGDATDYYNNIVFSPDGRLLASSSQSGSQFGIVLWIVAPGEPHEALANALTMDEAASPLGYIAFSPDGKQFASVSQIRQPPYNGILTLWNISIDDSWQQQACSIANRNLTPDELQQFLPSEAYSKACPGLAT